MKTLIKTTIKNNETIYVKENLTTVNKLIEAKGAFMFLTRRRYDNMNKVLSERKCLIRKGKINFIDQVK